MKALIGLIILAFSPLVWSYNYKIPKMTPPKAVKWQKRQLERMDIIDSIKGKGYAGESDNGLLKIRDLKGLKDVEKKVVEQSVADENIDRTNIYKEIAAYNKMKPHEKELLIKNAYEVYRNTSKKGTFYFEKGVWQKHY